MAERQRIESDDVEDGQLTKRSKCLDSHRLVGVWLDLMYLENHFMQLPTTTHPWVVLMLSLSLSLFLSLSLSLSLSLGFYQAD